MLIFSSGRTFRFCLPILAALAGCAGPQAHSTAPVTVQIIAFNDFHGNLEPPKMAVTAPAAGGGTIAVPAGGGAYLASAIDKLRGTNPNSVVVAAGDLIGASPLVSALFLDEPTIETMNLIHLDYSALGNHEFDKGRDELLRIAHGGCAAFTARKPCGLDPAFPGANFSYLAANTLSDGKPLFPPYAIKTFGTGRNRVKIGFIGLTLKAVPDMVTPTGVAGLYFLDEATAANALVPQMKREGADAIVILIHQGGQTDVGYDDKSCAGLTGDILPILDKLDPAIDVVVSGHTHRAYICDYGRTAAAHPILLTSAGLYGTLLTDITLAIDPRSHRVVARQADNIIVQGEGYTGSSGAIALTDQYPRFGRSGPVEALVARYAAAAAPLAASLAGHVAAAVTRTVNPAHESVLGDIVADADLAATRPTAAGGAQIAFTNPGGVRADLVPAPDGSVTYGQLFAVQPFGNTLTIKTMTGRQILALLEQQFDSSQASIASPRVLPTAATLHYAYDLSRPTGSRIADVRIEGVPIDPDRAYRVTMNSFLASGGDGFSLFKAGTQPLGGPQDLDALEAYLTKVAPLSPPASDRIKDVTP